MDEKETKQITDYYGDWEGGKSSEGNESVTEFNLKNMNPQVLCVVQNITQHFHLIFISHPGHFMKLHLHGYY